MHQAGRRGHCESSILTGLGIHNKRSSSRPPFPAFVQRAVLLSGYSQRTIRIDFMIDYNSKVWFRHITDFHKTDTFRVLLVEMSIVAAYAAFVASVENHLLPWILEKFMSAEQVDAIINKSFRDASIVHSILGFVLSMLLVFRTNTATYDRWWEGRKLWGASLVNNCRNLSFKISALLRPSSAHAADREYFAEEIASRSATIRLP